MTATLPRRIKRAAARAYEALVQDGSLRSKQQALILQTLVSGGPATSGEVLEPVPGLRNLNAWRGRFTELQARGLIRQVGERPCKVSGRLCIVWAPTGRDTPLDEGREHIATSRAAEWQECARRWREIADRMVDVIIGSSQDTGDIVVAEYQALAKQERTRERRRGRS